MSKGQLLGLKSRFRKEIGVYLLHVSVYSCLNTLID